MTANLAAGPSRGGAGTLRVDDDTGKPYIITGARVTGLRIISTRPGDFNGVVWNEEMDRAPRKEDD